MKNESLRQQMLLPFERCESWIGLEIPAAYDCDLPAGHQGCHISNVVGEVKNDKGIYVDEIVEIRWGFCDEDIAFRVEEWKVR